MDCRFDLDGLSKFLDSRRLVNAYSGQNVTDSVSLVDIDSYQLATLHSLPDVNGKRRKEDKDKEVEKGAAPVHHKVETSGPGREVIVFHSFENSYCQDGLLALALYQPQEHYLAIPWDNSQDGWSLIKKKVDHFKPDTVTFLDCHPKEDLEVTAKVIDHHPSEKYKNDLTRCTASQLGLKEVNNFLDSLINISEYLGQSALTKLIKSFGLELPGGWKGKEEIGALFFIDSVLDMYPKKTKEGDHKKVADYFLAEVRHISPASFIGSERYTRFFDDLRNQIREKSVILPDLGGKVLLVPFHGRASRAVVHLGLRLAQEKKASLTFFGHQSTFDGSGRDISLTVHPIPGRPLSKQWAFLSSHFGVPRGHEHVAAVSTTPSKFPVIQEFDPPKKPDVGVAQAFTQELPSEETVRYFIKGHPPFATLRDDGCDLTPGEPHSVWKSIGKLKPIPFKGSQSFAFHYGQSTTDFGPVSLRDPFYISKTKRASKSYSTHKYSLNGLLLTLHLLFDGEFPEIYPLRVLSHIYSALHGQLPYVEKDTTIVRFRGHFEYAMVFQTMTQFALSTYDFYVNKRRLEIGCCLCDDRWQSCLPKEREEFSVPGCKAFSFTYNPLPLLEGALSLMITSYSEVSPNVTKSLKIAQGRPSCLSKHMHVLEGYDGLGMPSDSPQHIRVKIKPPLLYDYGSDPRTVEEDTVWGELVSKLGLRPEKVGSRNFATLVAEFCSLILHGSPGPGTRHVSGYADLVQLSGVLQRACSWNRAPKGPVATKRPTLEPASLAHHTTLFDRFFQLYFSTGSFVTPRGFMASAWSLVNGKGSSEGSETLSVLIKGKEREYTTSSKRGMALANPAGVFAVSDASTRARKLLRDVPDLLKIDFGEFRLSPEVLRIWKKSFPAVFEIGTNGVRYEANKAPRQVNAMKMPVLLCQSTMEEKLMEAIARNRTPGFTDAFYAGNQIRGQVYADQHDALRSTTDMTSINFGIDSSAFDTSDKSRSSQQRAAKERAREFGLAGRMYPNGLTLEEIIETAANYGGADSMFSGEIFYRIENPAEVVPLLKAANQPSTNDGPITVYTPFRFVDETDPFCSLYVQKVRRFYDQCVVRMDGEGSVLSEVMSSKGRAFSEHFERFEKENGILIPIEKRVVKPEQGMSGEKLEIWAAARRLFETIMPYPPGDFVQHYHAVLSAPGVGVPEENSSMFYVRFPFYPEFDMPRMPLPFDARFDGLPETLGTDLRMLSGAKYTFAENSVNCLALVNGMRECPKVRELFAEMHSLKIAGDDATVELKIRDHGAMTDSNIREVSTVVSKFFGEHGYEMNPLKSVISIGSTEFVSITMVGGFAFPKSVNPTISAEGRSLESNYLNVAQETVSYMLEQFLRGFPAKSAFVQWVVRVFQLTFCRVAGSCTIKGTKQLDLTDKSYGPQKAVLTVKKFKLDYDPTSPKRVGVTINLLPLVLDPAYMGWRAAFGSRNNEYTFLAYLRRIDQREAFLRNLLVRLSRHIGLSGSLIPEHGMRAVDEESGLRFVEMAYTPEEKRLRSQPTILPELRNEVIMNTFLRTEVHRNTQYQREFWRPNAPAFDLARCLADIFRTIGSKRLTFKPQRFDAFSRLDYKVVETVAPRTSQAHRFLGCKELNNLIFAYGVTSQPVNILNQDTVRALAPTKWLQTIGGVTIILDRMVGEGILSREGIDRAGAEVFLREKVGLLNDSINRLIDNLEEVSDLFETIRNPPVALGPFYVRCEGLRMGEGARSVVPEGLYSKGTVTRFASSVMAMEAEFDGNRHLINVFSLDRAPIEPLEVSFLGRTSGLDARGLLAPSKLLIETNVRSDADLLAESLRISEANSLHEVELIRQLGPVP